MTAQSETRLFQFRLSTAIATLFVAGIFLYANTITRVIEYYPEKFGTRCGFPLDLKDGAEYFLNALICLGICYSFLIGMESWLQGRRALWQSIRLVGLAAWLPTALFLGDFLCQTNIARDPTFWGKGWPIPVVFFQRDHRDPAGAWSDFPCPIGGLANYLLAFIAVPAAVALLAYLA